MKRLLCLPSDDVRFAVLQLLASLVNTTSSIFSFYVCSSVFYFVHPDRSFNRHDIASRRTRTSQHIMEEEGLFDDIEQRMSCPLMRMHGFQRVPTEFRPLCNQLPINITFV
ncbi:hypothetical protein BLNAU_11290 [Blattamonas nauphoetae]|uniref:Uncharacterized protein n=1 Tax=Blattamonas nauphoetae TaxID=2049346 RepID=A0ABQ9XQU7_9EUKA|nr:hypothetical protein BLNAU_11290 [Blattamonas nauphoetae]